MDIKQQRESRIACCCCHCKICIKLTMKDLWRYWGMRCITTQENVERQTKSCSFTFTKTFPRFHSGCKLCEVPDFSTHFHEHRIGGHTILYIHKNENEATVFKVYETGFQIIKVTTFPFISLKSISYTFDLRFLFLGKRNSTRSVHIIFISFTFFFSISCCL